MVKCGFCYPHADPRKQRLCHVGEDLFAKYKQAGERYAALAQSPDSDQMQLRSAREDMTKARAFYRNHTDGGQ